MNEITIIGMPAGAPDTTAAALTVIRSALPTVLAADTSDILGKLAAEIATHRPDTSTKKGRAEIASLAAKVASSKMDLIRLGKSLTDGWRKSTAAVNAECKVIEDRMDTLKRQVRRPLDEIEATEAARTKANEDAIAALEALVEGLADLTADQVKERYRQAGVIAEFPWAIEFTVKAERVQNGVVAQLEVAHARAKARDAEAAAEAIRLAEEAEAERLAVIEAQRAREEQIARDAAEAAKLAAEAKAARDAQRADYHRRMLQHVKNCGFGFIDDQPQSSGILQYELTTKIKFDEENFGDLLSEALAAKDEALKLIQRAIDAGERRRAEEEAAIATKRALEAAEAKAAHDRDIAQQVAARAETARIAAHHAAMAIMRKLATPLAPPDPVPVIDAKLAQLQDVYEGDWEEFTDEADEIHQNCSAALISAREESIRLATERAEKDLADAIERERIAVERAEIARAAEAAKAEREKQAAVEAATLAEQRRAAAAKAEEDAEAERRALNVANRREVNREVLHDIVAALAHSDLDYSDGPDIGTQIAKAIITALAKGEIRHARIEY